MTRGRLSGSWTSTEKVGRRKGSDTFEKLAFAKEDIFFWPLRLSLIYQGLGWSVWSRAEPYLRKPKRDKSKTRQIWVNRGLQVVDAAKREAQEWEYIESVLTSSGRMQDVPRLILLGLVALWRRRTRQP